MDKLRHLTKLQFDVTQNKATEPPFDNEYNANFKPGIYVDIITKKPLFVSTITLLLLLAFLLCFSSKYYIYHPQG